MTYFQLTECRSDYVWCLGIRFKGHHSFPSYFFYWISLSGIPNLYVWRTPKQTWQALWFAAQIYEWDSLEFGNLGPTYLVDGTAQPLPDGNLMRDPDPEPPWAAASGFWALRCCVRWYMFVVSNLRIICHTENYLLLYWIN